MTKMHPIYIVSRKSGDEILYADMNFNEPLYRPKVKRNMEVLFILHNVPPLRIYLD